MAVEPKGTDEQVAAQDLIADQVGWDKMKEHFAKQEKVEVKVREQEWVQVNGYTFVIAPGVRVMVPVQIRDILEESGRI